MWIVDGAQGEGGGQVLRTALTLSLCRGVPVRIINIRAGREKPGLLRQHLACVKAAQQISNAAVEGAEIGSQEICFRQGEVVAGCYRFSVGSAGSASLVFQTVLLPLLLTGRCSDLLLEGGTHNGQAPSFDFIDNCFLPVLRAMGVETTADLMNFGFYPAGGGAWRVAIQPLKQWLPLQLEERGVLLGRQAVATSANIPQHVTRRELKQVQRLLEWSDDELDVRLVESVGQGNMLSLRLHYEAVREVVEVVGVRRLSAEKVASKAVTGVAELQRYLGNTAPVGEHLADQLLLPLALGAGGVFRMLEPSSHFETNAALINQLLGSRVEYQSDPRGGWLVTVKGE